MRIRNLDLDCGVHINYFDGFLWRWLSDEGKNWHDSYVIDFAAKDGKRYVLAKLGMVFAHGTDEKCDEALAEFKDLFESSRKEDEPNVEKKETDEMDIDVPNLKKLEDEGHFGELWDCGITSYHGEPIIEAGFRESGSELAEAIEAEEEMKTESEMDEWYSKTTEFTKGRLFQAVRDMMADYDLEETESGNQLVFEGKTKPTKICYNDDDGNWHEKMATLDYRLTSRWEEDICSFYLELTGHGKCSGEGRGLKTEQDLRELWVPRSDLLMPKKRKFEQMSLFDFM